MEHDKITREELFALFDKLGISHETTHHRPVFTVEEGEDIKKSIKGGHSKNLFLKDKNGKFFLICALGETQIKMNHVHKAVGCARLSFGSEDKLYEFLGVRPGSVTMFALANDRNKILTLVIDKAIFQHEYINFHPLLNDATTTIPVSDIAKFVEYWGGEALIGDFTTEIPMISNLAGISTP